MPTLLKSFKEVIEKKADFKFAMFEPIRYDFEKHNTAYVYSIIYKVLLDDTNSLKRYIHAQVLLENELGALPVCLEFQNHKTGAEPFVISSSDAVKRVVKELLTEIPSQMTAYMDMKNISPNVKADGTIETEIVRSAEIKELEKNFFAKRFEEIKKKAIKIAVDEKGQKKTEEELTENIESLISQYSSPDIRPEYLVQNISKSYNNDVSNKLKTAYQD